VLVENQFFSKIKQLQYDGVGGGGGGGAGGVKPFYHKMALFIGSLAPTHRSKMVWLRESFATF
jgi:hypothetical protein